MPRRRKIPAQSILEVEEYKTILPKKKTVSSWAGKILLILLLASAIFFAFAFYTYWSVAQKADKISENNKQSSQLTKNSQALIEKVGRLILLPKNEPPSIATINNVAQLQKDQPFYKDARNGDVMLIYFQAKKAYIYNPEANVIVNVGPVLMEKVSTDVSVSSTTSTSL